MKLFLMMMARDVKRRSAFSFSFKNKFLANKQTRSEVIEDRRVVISGDGGVLSVTDKGKPWDMKMSYNDLGHSNTGVHVVKIH